MLFIKKIRKKEDGQGLVEYALIIALIAIVLIAAVKGLGTGLDGVFSSLVEKINNF